MKVLHLISGGDTGGAKTHIMSLFHGLDKLIDAKIICFIEDSFYYDAREAGIDIEVYEQKSRADMTVVRRLAEEINSQGYDMVHCHGARANFVAMFLRFKVRVPFITTVHSDYRLDFKDNFYKRLVFTSLNTFALKRFKYFIAVSDSFKEMLVERGFRKDNIFTVYNGINMQQEPAYSDPDSFLKKYGIDIDRENKTLVGIMARLDQVKDHDTFLRAAAYAYGENQDLVFLIAGDGADRQRLEDLTRELGLEDVVYFLGHIDDAYSFLNTIDINTLSSLSESFPYAVLEGAFMKRTIISTKVGGLVNLIKEGENGYLVDVGDYEALGRRILELSLDREKTILFGKNLYQEVEKNYSSEKMAEDHVEIYRKILKRSGKEELK